MPFVPSSIGDIISISILIKDVVRSLDKVNGSSAEYQSVIRCLWSLDQALLEVEVLSRSPDFHLQPAATRESLTQTVQRCRDCITGFQEHIRKYDRDLGSKGSCSKWKSAASKIKWSFSETGQLARFGAEIMFHCAALDMMLATMGLAATRLDAGEHKSRFGETAAAQRESSRVYQETLASVVQRVGENAELTRQTLSALQLLNSKFDTTCVPRISTDVLVSIEESRKLNLKIHNKIANIEACLPAQLNKTWTQDPVMLQDALGRNTPFHLEFIDSWDVFDTVLEARFRQLPGHGKIQNGEFALRGNFLDKDIDRSRAINRAFLPGQRIEMSMIFDDSGWIRRLCPGCGVEGDVTCNSPITCNYCGMWYQRSVQESVLPQGMIKPEERPSKRKRDVLDQADEPQQFRRVQVKREESMREYFKRTESEMRQGRLRSPAERGLRPLQHEGYRCPNGICGPFWGPPAYDLENHCYRHLPITMQCNWDSSTPEGKIPKRAGKCPGRHAVVGFYPGLLLVLAKMGKLDFEKGARAMAKSLERRT